MKAMCTGRALEAATAVAAPREEADATTVTDPRQTSAALQLGSDEVEWHPRRVYIPAVVARR